MVGEPVMTHCGSHGSISIGDQIMEMMRINEDSIHATHPRFPAIGVTAEEWRLRLIGQLVAVTILFGLVTVLAVFEGQMPQVGPSYRAAHVGSLDEENAAIPVVDSSRRDLGIDCDRTCPGPLPMASNVTHVSSSESHR
jgi:hypothetical protein